MYTIHGLFSLCRNIINRFNLCPSLCFVKCYSHQYHTFPSTGKARVWTRAFLVVMERIRLCLCGGPAVECLHRFGILGAFFLNGLLQDHILYLSKTLVQISTNSSKMTLLGRRVVTINLVERWLIHPNPGPVMSPLCQFSHPFLHLFPDYLRSDI